MTQVQGFCDERFGAFEAMLAANLDNGLDVGASVAVFVDGEPVVDLWGGWADRERTKRWVQDTLVCVFSTSKIMVFTAVLMLWERGQLDLDAPICRYWPEFAANGKSRVTTRQVLTHRSGLPCFGQTISQAQITDWAHMIAVLERAPLVHAPGEGSCYSTLTVGFILGELVARVSGHAFPQFVSSEITEPLHADFHFGITSASDRARVSEVFFPTTPPPVPPAELAQRVLGELEPSTTPFGIAPIDAVVPAAGGITNARALARVGSMLANRGELGGRRHLATATVDAARTEQSYVKDDMLGWCRLGLGFGLHSREFAAPTPTSFHWGGWGGSFLTMDPATKVSCAYAPNLMRMADQFDDRGVLWEEPRFGGWWKLAGDASRSLNPRI
jgi:CubicO group peptidase (beta-lactamase class C family)